MYVNHGEICEACKKVVATKEYELYSNIDDEDIFSLKLCEDCYVLKLMDDWEDFE